MPPGSITDLPLKPTLTTPIIDVTKPLHLNRQVHID